MRVLSRAGSWKFGAVAEYSAPPGSHVQLAPFIWHGPGHGGATNGGIVAVKDGDEWPEGNPDAFFAFQWTAPAAHGEAHYVARGQQFRFTWFENKGIKSARVGAGKRVCAAFWLRSPYGCSVTPVIWRGNLPVLPEGYATFPEIPTMQLWGGTDQILTPNTKVRVNFVFDLPALPPVQLGPDSYVGFGLDFLYQYGPCVHVGPHMLYEILPGEPDIQPIPEVPYWEETAALQVP